MSDRTAPDGLDASFIISQASKRDRIPPTEELPPDTRRRKTRSQDYESLFMHDAPDKTRSSKTVYIRKKHHDRIMKIIRVIGGGDISLFSYLDNVLEHHFATFQEDIEELYNKRNSGIFQE